MKYIFTRHWDYWYNVYQIGSFKNVQPDAVEFHISNEINRETEFFHFDFYNLSALTKIVQDDEFMDSDDSDYPNFLNKVNALKSREIDFFIGSLYYPTFYPDINNCNNALLDGKTIFDIKSPVYKPYYATIFIGEERPLMPDLLIDWTMKICKVLFKEEFHFQIAEIPTFEETLEYYKGDGRF